MAERLESLRFYREAFVVQFKTALAVELQYRAAEVIWLLFFVLKPLMFLSVWTAVARAARDTGGYAPADLVAYFLITMWVVHLTFNGVLVFFEGRVRRGDFSPLLLRPIYPIAGDLAANLAYKALTIPLMTVATAVLFATFQPRLETPRWAVAAFVPALLLALVVRFVITWMVGLAAFWLTRTQAVTQLFLFLLLFLGGEAAPLTLLPGWVQVVAWWSPFRWMLAFPVELLLGRLTPAQALAGRLTPAALLGAVAVAAALLALSRWFWNRGLRHYAGASA